MMTTTTMTMMMTGRARPLEGRRTPITTQQYAIRSRNERHNTALADTASVLRGEAFDRSHATRPAAELGPTVAAAGLPPNESRAVDAQVDVQAGMCRSLCSELCIDFHADMCTGLCVDMCTGICMDMCTDASTARCSDMRMGGSYRTNTGLHMCMGVRADVYLVMCMSSCMGMRAWTCLNIYLDM